MLSFKGAAIFWSAAAITILSLVIASNIIALLQFAGIKWESNRQYSYEEFDFPPSLIPLSQHPYNARLIVEDSVHYELNNSAEWHTLFPSSGGFVRLGPNYRLFGVSMFHQLHCLDKMRRAVLDEPPSEWERWHTQHCLNYVRQMLLCAASMRLEPVKEAVEGSKVDGLGLEHTCRDWGVLRSIVEENFKEWLADTHP